MKLSILVLSILVALAVLSDVDARRNRRPPGPCTVANCDRCNASGRKCKECSAGFKTAKRGKKCKSLPCTPNPCENGGTCATKGRGRRKVEKCTCIEGFSGDRCEINDLCTPNPCQNGGTCSGEGVCTCAAGFIGDDCRHADPCDPDPCQNGGVCSAPGRCTCAGFIGNYCETLGERITEATWPYGTFVMATSGQLVFNWNNGRPQASGQIDESGAVHTGQLTFPDDRQYSIHYYPSERAIYWGGDKGATGNIWRGN